MMEPTHFGNITLLITHYNRSKSLERLLLAFKDLQVSFSDIIVSDDCSKPEHKVYIESLKENYKFQFITGSVNKGLGNNINKGQDAVTSDLTLYIQEDFVPLDDFPAKLSNAVEIMQERSDIDMVRFYAYFNYPYLKDYKYGFSEMIFSFWKLGYKKFYYYSDHPHLRRSNFLQKFGRYKEGVNPEKAEYGMMLSVLQKKGKAMFFRSFKSLLDQKNSASEPSTMKRNMWRESGNPFISLMREIYRHLKFNYDYLFGKY